MKLSVIIPAYNCADTITQTLDSVLSQNISDFEIIAVNDGSTDNTLNVLNSCMKKDKRIRLISTKNKGPAHARNTGISEAAGEYIAFVDSDDLLYPNMYYQMLSLAEKHDLDIVASGYVMENISKNKTHIKKFTFEPFIAKNPDEFHEKLTPMIRAHVMYAVWNKIFKKSFLLKNNITFPDFLSGEDRLFNISTFSLITRFGFIKGPFYRYILHGTESLANRYVKNRLEASLTSHKTLLKSYKEMGILNNENKTAVDFQFIKSVMACFTQLYTSGCPLNHKEKREFVKNTLLNPLIQDAIQKSDSELSYSIIVNWVLRTNNKTLILLMAKAIYLMQYRLNSLYLKLKHNVKSNS